MRKNGTASDAVDWDDVPEANRMSGSWEWNIRLTIATILCAGLTLLTGFFLYQRSSRQIPPNLLKLADEAESDGDWRLAAMRLSQYLRFEIDDVATMRRLGDLYYHNATVWEDAQRGAQLYAISFRQSETSEPATTAMRLRHVEILAKMDSPAALSYLNTMLPEDDLDAALKQEPNLVEALRLKIALLERDMPSASTMAAREAREQLIKLNELLAEHIANPARTRQTLAVLYRQKAEAVELADKRSASQLRRKADRIMDEEVASNPDDIEVLLRRFEYQIRHVKSPHPDTSDLRRALDLDPSNPSVLQSLASFMADPTTDQGDVSRASLIKARDFLAKSKDEMKMGGALPVAQSKILIRLGEPEAAAEVLEEAAREFPEYTGVHTARANLAIKQGRFEKAADSIESLRRLSNQVLSRSRPDGDARANAVIDSNTADILEAHHILAQPGPSMKADASKLLDSIDQARLQLFRRIDLLENMAILYSGLGKQDEAIATLNRARSVGSLTYRGLLLLAESYRSTGQLDLALVAFTELAERPLDRSRARQVWFSLGSLSLKMQSNRLELYRDWTDVETAITEMQRIAPASEDTFILSNYVRLERGNVDRAALISDLQKAESRFGDSAQFWLLCANAYRRIEAFRLQQHAIDKMSNLSEVVPGTFIEKSERSAARIYLSDEDRDAIRELSAARGLSTEAKTARIRRWCQDQPESIAAHNAMLNLGIDINQFALVNEAVKSLRSIEAGIGYFWRIAEIRRHLMRFQQGDMQEGLDARRKAEGLVGDYPGQPQVVMLAATAQEMSGDSLAASDSYEIAFKIQSRGDALDGRLRTLVLQNDWERAVELVDLIPKQHWATPSRLELIVHVLCQHRRYAEALAAVRAAEALGWPTAQTSYLLAMVRMRQGSRAEIIEAHEHLTRATRLAPNNLAYWISMLHFELTYYPELWTADACRTAQKLKWLLKSHAVDYSPAWSSLVIAQVLQLNGQVADADEFYRRALASDPRISQTEWVNRRILSKDITAESAEIAPAIAWLAGERAVRALSVVLALWSGSPHPEYPIEQDEPRLKALLAVNSQNLPQAIELLQGFDDKSRGCGDSLLIALLSEIQQDPAQARMYFRYCLRDPRIPASPVRLILLRALISHDYELARQCLAVGSDDAFDPLTRKIAEARIGIGLKEFDESTVDAVLSLANELAEESDRRQFIVAMADFLANSADEESALALMVDSSEIPPDSPAIRIWLCSHESLARRGAESLRTALMEDPPEVVIEMMYKLTHSLPPESEEFVYISTLASHLRDAAPKLSAVAWTKLASVFERLGQQDNAIAACESALDEVSGPSLIEHYLIWLRGAYTDDQDDHVEELTRLVQRYGPREDLMDTRAVLALIAGDTAKALSITGHLRFLDPYDMTFQFNHELAVAATRPSDQRRELLHDMDDQLIGAASIPAKTLRDRWIAADRASND